MGETLGSWSLPRLRRFCDAAGRGEAADALAGAFREMGASWFERPLDDPPGYSELFLNGTPYDLSLALTPGEPTEVRCELEPQFAPPSVEAYNRATEAYFEALRRDGRAELGEFEAYRDALGRSWAVHPAAAVGADARPLYKGYITRHYRFERQFDALPAALRERDFAPAAAALEVLRGERVDVLALGFDLEATARARIKIYASLWPWEPFGPDALRTIASAAPGSDGGELVEFLRRLFGPPPWGGFFNFTLDRETGGLAAPTVYVPLLPFLNAHGPAVSDRELAGRIADVLSQYGLDGPGYARAFEALVEGAPPGSRTDCNFHVSFRLDRRGRPRAAAYFCPPAYGDRAPPFVIRSADAKARGEGAPPR